MKIPVRTSPGQSAVDRAAEMTQAEKDEFVRWFAASRFAASVDGAQALYDVIQGA